MRKALVHLPTEYNQKEPSQLLIAFHGRESNAELFEKSTGFSIEDITKDSIVVYPDGLDGTWTGSTDAPLTSVRNDLSFVTDLLDTLEEKFCVDRSRIYATGHDTGAGLVALMACHPFLSQRIAAFAPVSATVYESSALKQPLFEYCAPGRNHVPILSVHGEDDEVAPYFGPPDTLPPAEEGQEAAAPPPATQSVPSFLQGWAERNGCNTAKGNVTSSMYDGKVLRSTFRCGEGRTRLVEGWRMRDASHAWYRRIVGDIANDDFKLLDASEIVVKWFGVHDLPAALFATDPNTASHGSPSQPENAEDTRHGTEPVAEEQGFANDDDNGSSGEDQDHGKAYLDIGEVKIEHFGNVVGPDVTRTTTHTNVISIAVQKFETKNDEGEWATHDAKATSAPASVRDEL